LAVGGKSCHQYVGSGLSSRHTNLTLGGNTLHKNPSRKVDYDAVYLACGSLPSNIYVRASLSYDSTNGPGGLQPRLRNIGVRFNGSGADSASGRKTRYRQNLICYQSDSTDLPGSSYSRDRSGGARGSNHSSDLTSGR
jgi:hypothetical protein